MSIIPHPLSDSSSSSAPAESTAAASTSSKVATSTSASSSSSIPISTTSSSSTPLSTSSLSSSSSSSIVVVTSTSSSLSSSTSSTPLSTSTSTSSSSSSSSIPPTSVPVTTPTAPKTSTVFVSASNSPTPSSTAVSRVSNGFFSHKGEVAGVFAVVGIVVLVIIAVVATTCIRRRRAKRFDDDVAEAAMEAAATSRTHGYDDDQYPAGGYGASKYPGYSGDGAAGYNGGGAAGYGGGATVPDNSYPAGYSSESHGTYGQPPMEAYAMHNVGPAHGGYDVGQVVDPAMLAGAAGAAGIGAMRARSQNRGNPEGYEEHTPFAAFAGPPQQGGAGRPGQGDGLRYRRTSGMENELIDAAGLGAAAGAPGMNRRLSERTAQTHLSNPRSVGSFPPVAEDVPVGYNNNATSSTGHSPSANDESYASHYQPGYQGKPQPAVPAEDPFRRNTMQAQQASPGGGMPNPYGDSDGEEGEDPYAYDGYADEHHPEARASLEDDGFYGATPRVLKVANE